MKTDKNYRMTKPTKMILSNIIDPHERGRWKRLMIDAEAHAKSVERAVYDQLVPLRKEYV